jgi:HSP20 family molecular chaperone IbpA
MNKKIKDIGTTVDVLNTINGGISEPFVSIRELSAGREVRVRVPGLNKEAIEVEIINNELAIFYAIPLFSTGKQTQVPQIIYNKHIPYFIEAGAISAYYENNELIVHMPFIKSSHNYNRKIRID